MRRPNVPRPPRHRGRPTNRIPRSEARHVVLISGGLALYLACLWLGLVVIGDSLARSAVMAGLIVAIAAVGYVFTHGPTRPGGR